MDMMDLFNNCWTVKDIKVKGEDNMEVNFIEMMKDSAENGTVYMDSYGVLYKADSFGLLYVKYKCKKDFELYNEIVCKQLACQKYTKVEQYKEITTEEAITAIRDGKEVKFDSQGSKRTLDRTAPMSMNTLLNIRFYIKE